MALEESVNKSILDKPLHLLTEDDISQLTREDCRRYLKDKGMRRPSWNKSQAIQQVISLKTLLEPSSDSGKRLFIPRPQTPPNPAAPRGTSVDTEISVSADEFKDPNFETDRSGDLPAGVVADKESVPPRNTGVANVSVEQMTIFYCGKVNVYDDVPADKAQTIMMFAASPFLSPHEIPHDGTTEVRSLPCNLQAGSVKVGTLQSARSKNPPMQRKESNIFREENPDDVSASREALLQRYREKKKDRFRCKRKIGIPSASFDLYSNHQIGNRSPNENSGRSACSLAQIKPPNMTNCSSLVDNNRVKSANLSPAMGDRELQDQIERSD